MMMFHATISYTRTGGRPTAKFSKFTKHHFKIQARHQGADGYNELLSHLRREVQMTKCIKEESRRNLGKQKCRGNRFGFGFKYA